MKKTALILNTLLIAGLFATVGAKAAMAGPHLIMSPSTGTYAVDGTFSVTVKVDSGTETVGGVDGVGTYDSAKLELVSVTKASPMVFEATDSGGGCSISSTAGVGKFSFSCYSNDALSDKVINGDLVVLNFKAKAAGTAAAAFTCASGSTTDSNIVKSSTATDVIVCGENIDGSYTISSSGSTNTTATNTPTPTTTTTTTTTSSSSTITASELPKTGGVGATFGLVIFGIISFASVALLKFL
jgi:hypothetical protein